MTRYEEVRAAQAKGATVAEMRRAVTILRFDAKRLAESERIEVWQAGQDAAALADRIEGAMIRKMYRETIAMPKEKLAGIAGRSYRVADLKGATKSALAHMILKAEFGAEKLERHL